MDATFANLVNSAPEALNQLSELANALANDANYATTIQNQLATKATTSALLAISLTPGPTARHSRAYGGNRCNGNSGNSRSARDPRANGCNRSNGSNRTST